MSVEELEELRKKVVRLHFIIVLFVFAAGAVLAVLKKYNSIPLLFFVLIFLLVIVPAGKRNKYIKEFKNTFVKSSLEKVYTDLEYEPDHGIDYNVIAGTGMMYMGDRYHSGDYVRGKYKNILVEQADVHIEEEHEDSDGDTTYSTIFRGKWMIFEFNKTFKANIQVREKGFNNATTFKLFAKKEEKYKKVEMEDQAFNKEFKVFAQDEHDAFYILTPQLMDKIRTLNEKVKGKLLLCFVDNKLHVGLHNNRDDFEPKIIKSINEEEITSQIVEQIKLVTDFVDELDLSNDLFKINTSEKVNESNN